MACEALGLSKEELEKVCYFGCYFGRCFATRMCVCRSWHRVSGCEACVVTHTQWWGLGCPQETAAVPASQRRVRHGTGFSANRRVSFFPPRRVSFFPPRRVSSLPAP
jgi:hypothetical protein